MRRPTRRSIFLYTLPASTYRVDPFVPATRHRLLNFFNRSSTARLQGNFSTASPDQWLSPMPPLATVQLKTSLLSDDFINLIHWFLFFSIKRFLKLPSKWFCFCLALVQVIAMLRMVTTTACLHAASKQISLPMHAPIRLFA